MTNIVTPALRKLGYEVKEWDPKTAGFEAQLQVSWRDIDHHKRFTLYLPLDVSLDDALTAIRAKAEKFESAEILQQTTK